MKIELRKFGFGDYLRILFRTLNREYSKEREDTFFSYFPKGLKSVFQKDSYEFAILVDGKFAGNIGFMKKPKENYEVGYSVLKKYRGKSIATSALSNLLKDFEKLGKITAVTDTENKASQKVLLNNNFKLTKQNKKKDELIWELAK